MNEVLQVIQAAAAKEAFLSFQDLAYLRKRMERNSARIDTVQKLSENASIIVERALSTLVGESADWIQVNADYQIDTCSRDCEIILRYITYALLAGDSSVLYERCLYGLQETYVALGISTDLVIRAVNSMKAAAAELIDNPDLATEVVGYFERVAISLKAEELQPLWQTLVEIGNQIPEDDWAKLPTDLSRNFEHYMYGAPKEV